MTIDTSSPSLEYLGNQVQETNILNLKLLLHFNWQVRKLERQVTSRTNLILLVLQKRASYLGWASSSTTVVTFHMLSSDLLPHNNLLKYNSNGRRYKSNVTSVRTTYYKINKHKMRLLYSVQRRPAVQILGFPKQSLCKIINHQMPAFNLIYFDNSEEIR